jgi:FkbM family methyltransferase
MKKIIIELIYKFFFVFDRLCNRKLFFYLFERFQESAYVEKKILNKKVKFFVPNQIINWRIKTLFDQEPETIDWINSFKGNKITFWDIGANIGLYSIYAAILHKDIEIISFEPSTSNLRVLSRNISINNLENKIKINQFALSDIKNTHEIMKETKFLEGFSMSTYAYQTDFEGNKIIPDQKYRIFGTTIDYLLEEKIIGFPNYVKIDVDGIEHKILSSAIKMLCHDNIKSIIIELNENYKEQYNSVLNLMNKNDFILIDKKQLDSAKNGKFSQTYNYIFNKKNEN